MTLFTAPVVILDNILGPADSGPLDQVVVQHPRVETFSARFGVVEFDALSSGAAPRQSWPSGFILKRWRLVAGSMILSLAHTARANVWRLNDDVQKALLRWFTENTTDEMGIEMWGVIALCGKVSYTNDAAEFSFAQRGKFTAKLPAMQTFRQLFFANYAGLGLRWRA